MASFKVSGNIVDIHNEEIFPGTVHVGNGKIEKIERDEGINYEKYIMPGFIDAHVHIESSMMVPSEFARLASVHGTVASVSDPHEIANVLGIEGVNFMIGNGKKVPFKFYFGAPSCVPATPFETSGATISAEDLRELLSRDEIKYMSEMMNFPGVLNEFPDVMEKLNIAKEAGKPVDGHAPGLTGKDAEKYIKAGITTDHECYSLDEAIDKIYYGMKILIREGSAAKNYEELHKLIEARPEMCMFCSDDKHPDDLVNGHINKLVERSVSYHGYSIMKTLRVATKNAVEHYGLDVGLLREGDDADFIVVKDIERFRVEKTFIKGKLVAQDGKTYIERVDVIPANKFVATRKKASNFKVNAVSTKIHAIEALDGEIITNRIVVNAKADNGNLVSDVENDILKIAVIDRYKNSEPSIGFIKNFGLKRGAIATSVAHDSHNVIAVGTSDEELAAAVNAVIDGEGGMAVTDAGKTVVQPLPVAGLMSHGDGYDVAEKYSQLDKEAKKLGSQLHAPFMTLSFMALLVIPKLKLSDKGLFDGEKFEFIDLEVHE